MATESQTPAAPSPAPTPAPDVTPPTAPTTPPAEAPKDAPQAPTPPEKLGASFAKLAAQQKAAREAQEKLKAERTAFEGERTKYAEALKELEALKAAKEEAKRFPLKFLQAHGLTYQDVSEAQLNGGEPTPSLEVKALQDKFSKLEQEQQEKEKAAAESERQRLQAQQQELVKSFRAKVEEDVKAQTEAFEYVNTFGEYDKVFQVIDAHAALQLEKGVKPHEVKLLSIKEAAEAVEKDLEESFEKLSKTKKWTAKQAPQVAAPEPTRPVVRFNVQPPTPTPTPTRTLSNNLTATTPSAKTLSFAERERRAMEILRQGRPAQ